MACRPTVPCHRAGPHVPRRLADRLAALRPLAITAAALFGSGAATAADAAPTLLPGGMVPAEKGEERTPPGLQSLRLRMTPGSRPATVNVELVNRGADIYPINTVEIVGDNAEEFITDLRDPITLNPAEKVTIGVTFAPIDEGRKFASLDIDFDTIVQVDEGTNVNEQNFYRARDLERSRDYQGARDAYDTYVDNDPVTVNKQRAAIKLPVIDEGERYGSGDDFALYLEAMNARDGGDPEVAAAKLDTLLFLHPESYIADDALYLKAYAALMDEGDHAAALRSFQQLRRDYPDTTYYDTALYGEALAQQGLGNDTIARSIFLDLRLRHTGVDAFGVTRFTNVMTITSPVRVSSRPVSRKMR